MKTTIIIPLNIDRGFLGEAIESAKGQGLIDVRCSSGSVGYNVNDGIRNLKTPYYCVLAEDDILPSNAIAKREAFIESGDYDFIHSRGETFGDVCNPIPWINPYPTLQEMVQFNRICGSTLLYKAECGLWDESLKTAEEYDYHMRLLSEGKRLGFLDEVTFKYRRHSGQKSLGNASRDYQKDRMEKIEIIKNRYR